MHDNSFEKIKCANERNVLLEHNIIVILSKNMENDYFVSRPIKSSCFSCYDYEFSKEAEISSLPIFMALKKSEIATRKPNRKIGKGKCMIL